MFRRRLLTMTLVLELAAIGCSAEKQNGEDCLKDDDCESHHCVQQICQAPGSTQPTDATPSETAGDVSDAPTEAASDSALETAVDVVDAPSADTATDDADVGGD